MGSGGAAVDDGVMGGDGMFGDKADGGAGPAATSEGWPVPAGAGSPHHWHLALPSGNLEPHFGQIMIPR